MVESLWEAMDDVKFSTILREKIRHFNDKFFKDKTALSLNHDQVELLVEAAKCKWNLVEPAIFGTLLERALDPVERHKLGATQTAFAGSSEADDDKKLRPTKMATTAIEKLPWPRSLPERMVAIQSSLQGHTGPATSQKIAACYTRASKADVAELLETLAIVRRLQDGRFAVDK